MLPILASSFIKENEHREVRVLVSISWVRAALACFSTSYAPISSFTLRGLQKPPSIPKGQ